MNKKEPKIVKTPSKEKEGKIIWTEYKKTNPYKIFTYTDPIPEEDIKNSVISKTEN